MISKATCTLRTGQTCIFKGVRTVSSERGKGIGSKLILWAIERVKERGCHIIQLTTDKKASRCVAFL
ncbi:GNAT family N-acetyltransferase [Paenibacillus sp. GCM10027629]|uniref:GNAT family N-acetyltransferase n=1 Tax=Paenibacillus sp. GCM10027629 TaxID=3273414 RepID=UPI00362D7B71